MSNEVDLKYIDTSVELNFEIAMYGEETLEYKILLDFIETDTVGDIF